MKEEPKTFQGKKRVCLSVGSLWVWQHQEKPELQVLPLGQSLYAVVPLRNRTSMFVFHVYAPTSNKEEICQAYLREDFTIYLQKNSYFSFYDKNGQYWLFYLKKHTEESMRDLLHAVTMARCQSPFEDFKTISQNLSIVSGDLKEISTGDFVTITYTIWALSKTEHPWEKGALIVENRSSELRVGRGNWILGIEQSLTGMVKEQKRLLVVPGRLVKAKSFVEHNIPWENPIIVEVEITDIMFVGEEELSLSQSLSQMGAEASGEAAVISPSQNSNSDLKVPKPAKSPENPGGVEVFTQQHQHDQQKTTDEKDIGTFKENFIDLSAPQAEPDLGATLSSKDPDIRNEDMGRSSNTSAQQAIIFPKSSCENSTSYSDNRVNEYYEPKESRQSFPERTDPYYQKGFQTEQQPSPDNTNYQHLSNELKKVHQKLDWMHSARAVDKSEIQKLNDWVTSILNRNRETGNQLNYLHRAYESLMAESKWGRKEMKSNSDVKPSYLLEQMTTNLLEMNKNLGIVLKSWHAENTKEAVLKQQNKQTLEVSEKMSQSATKENNLALQVRSLKADLKKKDILISEKSREISTLLAKLAASEWKLKELIPMRAKRFDLPDLQISNCVARTSIPRLDLEITSLRNWKPETRNCNPKRKGIDSIQTKLSIESNQWSTCLDQQMEETKVILSEQSNDLGREKNLNCHIEAPQQESHPKSYKPLTKQETSTNSADLLSSPPAAAEGINPSNGTVVMVKETPNLKVKDKKDSYGTDRHY